MGTTTTTKNLRHILPGVLKKIGKTYEERPDLILAAWPLLVGDRIASMTKASSFIDGILTIKVKNSSLLSLLAQHERSRLLRELRAQFSNAKIRNIRFCIG
ncbi:MAG: DUF721 domain-containing protein [Simkaniaceae bacterium]|nr:DUF721 domain-containing protein [Candidatus Sacchlamyda saccharinae]